MKKRILALLLCFTLLLGLLPAALTAAADGDVKLNVYKDESTVSAVTLYESSKLTLTARPDSNVSGAYQWQIKAGSQWANIVGSASPSLELSFAMVANLLDDYGQAFVRCRFITSEGKEVYSDEITVQMDVDPAQVAPMRAPARAPISFTILDPGSVVIHETDSTEPTGETEPTEVTTPTEVTDPTDPTDSTTESTEATEQPSTPTEAPTEAPVTDPAPAESQEPAPAAEESDFSLAAAFLDLFTVSAHAEGEVKPTYNIVINYVDVSGNTVASPYTASLAEGSTFDLTVTFPTVQGYLPYYKDEQVNSIKEHIDSISQDFTLTVVYKPTDVNYTVIHYQQNVDNDQYAEVARETKQGLTNSVVPDVAKSYDGFYVLPYEQAKIAASGDTIIEVYYDRYYYLMNFDLDGGYGTDPIYARYGAKIENVKTPTKAGYTFGGWSETKEDQAATDLPATMPCVHKTYYAIWETNATAKVTIVVWGENADDEKYSYIKSSEIQAKPGTTLTKEDLTHILTCSKEEHDHAAAGCTLSCGHVHTLACYGLRANATSVRPNDNTASWCDSKPETYFAQLGLEDGYLYYDDENAVLSSKDNYYLRLNGAYYSLSREQFNKLKGDKVGETSDNTSWNPDFYYKYKVKARGMSCTHTHTDSCYTCGKVAHKHNANCYTSPLDMDATLWKLVKSDEKTVAADGTTIINVYYDRVEFTLHFRKANSKNDDYGTITKKWGAKIRDEFSAKSTQAGTSNWSETRDASDPWTSYLDIMPTQDRWYYAYTEGYGTSTAYYYVEGLDGKDQLFYENKSTGTGYTVTVEEFIEIEGFTFNAARSAKVGNNFDGAKFYYTRNSYTLSFYNYNRQLTEKDATVKYEAPLGSYYFVPDYPAGLEPNAYEFDGWYTTAGCYDGSEADLNNMTMPASKLILYAKWKPITHKVEFHLTENHTEVYKPNGDNEALFKVDHGGNIAKKYVEAHLTEKAMNDAKPYGDYTFVVWFYYENGQKKYFDPTMQIRQDMVLYGEWSSKNLKPYTVRFVVQGTDTKVADDVTGSALVATTKTFDAKGGTELYLAYQEGYFPTVKSDSLVMSIDGENILTFEYVQAEKVPYTVKYINTETNTSVFDGTTVPDKVVNGNRKAVVTETFLPISGYMPDAYQKRLVVTPNGENILYFYYTKDSEHAYYKITHYTENLEGGGWTEYASSQAQGDIGKVYTAEPMTIPGFTCDEKAEETVKSGTLTANGLELKLYYTRNLYPYVVRYVEDGTGKELSAPKTASAKYGAVISENAIDIENYDKKEPTSATLNIRIEEGEQAAINIIYFRYTEKEVTINYQVVGPDGCGTVSLTSEKLKVLTGTPQGSTPTANPGYRFVGWYTSADCVFRVDDTIPNAVDPATNKLTPQKRQGDTGTHYEWTYYAKFEYDLVDLTITKTGYNSIDGDQSFIFKVTCDGQQVAEVVIHGNGSAVITGLKVGKTYTVTEETAWSWRYKPAQATQQITLQGGVDNAVTFVNTRETDKWLSGDCYADNRFTN